MRRGGEAPARCVMGKRAGSGKRGRGRPSKFTPEVCEAICRYLRQGHYFTVACRMAGIAPSTGCHWLERGRTARSGRFFEFLNAVESAQAKAEDRALRRWLEFMDKDWRAAAEFLARRFPERWRPRQVTEVTGEGGGAVRIIIEDARTKGQHGQGDDGSVNLFE